jgi:DNA-directed RNA polymerase specialized sigma24 family protein
VRVGDHAAFAVLFDEHSRAVYNLAFRLTANWSIAEEAVSLTFLEAWRLRASIEPEGGSLRPWLLGIAINVNRNMSRAARRHRAALSRLPASDKPSPDMAANGVHIKCPYLGSLNDPSYRLLQPLPTDPRALLNLIYKQTAGAGQSPDQEAFTTIGDLLRESIAPPDVSAALFRAAALIPGVTVVHNAVDAAGRRGVAVAFTFNGERSEWIFDKHTFHLLGELDFVDGTLTGKSAIITRAFVDHLGQVPSTG